MGKKLFIGNLSFSVSSEGLQDLFGQVGTVESAKVITDRESGRSKGFGFVEMSSPEEASECITQFNGREYEGRQMNVSEAKPQAPREGGGGRGGFGGGNGGGGNRRGGFSNRF